jgi:hypothetical protein
VRSTPQRHVEVPQGAHRLARFSKKALPRGYCEIRLYTHQIPGIIVLKPATDYLLLDNIAVSPERQGLIRPDKSAPHTLMPVTNPLERLNQFWRKRVAGRDSMASFQ